jgi:hypothetical protein
MAAVRGAFLAECVDGSAREVTAQVVRVSYDSVRGEMGQVSGV